MNLTIRTRLYSSTALLLAMVFMMALLNFYVSRQSSAALSDMYEQVLLPSRALWDLDASLREIELDMDQVLTGQASAAAAFSDLRERRRQMTGAWSAFRRTQQAYPVGQEELSLSRDIDQKLALAQPLFDQLEQAYVRQDAHRPGNDIEYRIHALRANIAGPLDKLGDIEREEAKELSLHGSRLSGRVILLSILALTVSIPCMAWFAFWLVRHIDRNIDRINRALAHVAQGELDVKVAVTSRDEIGKMADSLNRTLAIIKAGRDSLETLRRRDELILDALGEGLFGEDTEARITFVNPAMEKMLGWSAAELMGRRSRDLFEIADATRCEVQEQADGMCHGGISRVNGQAFRRKDGSKFPVEYTRTRLRKAETTLGAVVVFRDVSERKLAQDELVRRYGELQELNRRLEQAQGQLLQSEKMASLGQLAAGVAHEINNPVGFVKSNLSTLAQQVAGLLMVIDAYQRAESALSADADTLAAIAAAQEAADFDYLREDIGRLISESADGVARVQAIVRDLKEFSHPDDAERQLTDLRKGLDSTLNIAWNELKYKATVVKEYGEMPQVECVSAQINQVFMNLLVNAAQAIDRQGTITLRSGADVDGVWVEVADTGKGIPPEQLSRIFEPFFTTKPVGQGTGLGLSLAYGIVAKHGGVIDVRSEVGKGSVFRVRLPISSRVALELEPTGL